MTDFKVAHSRDEDHPEMALTDPRQEETIQFQCPARGRARADAKEGVVHPISKALPTAGALGPEIT